MKKFQVTVNGNTYEVDVEELQEGQTVTTPVVSAPKKAVATAPAPKKAVAAAPKKTSTGSVGATKVTAPMPGKIVDVKVTEGQSVKEGDVLVVLEAMKMENEIVAPKNGTIASVNVVKGGTVDAAELLVSIN